MENDAQSEQTGVRTALSRFIAQLHRYPPQLKRRDSVFKFNFHNLDLWWPLALTRGNACHWQMQPPQPKWLPLLLRVSRNSEDWFAVLFYAGKCNSNANYKQKNNFGKHVANALAHGWFQPLNLYSVFEDPGGGVRFSSLWNNIVTYNLGGKLWPTRWSSPASGSVCEYSIISKSLQDLCGTQYCFIYKAVTVHVRKA